MGCPLTSMFTCTPHMYACSYTYMCANIHTHLQIGRCLATGGFEIFSSWWRDRACPQQASSGTWFCRSILSQRALRTWGLPTTSRPKDRSGYQFILALLNKTLRPGQDLKSTVNFGLSLVSDSELEVMRTHKSNGV